MKTPTHRANNVLITLAIVAGCCFGVGQAFAQPAAQKPPASRGASIKFLPKTSGAASVRVTGGSRGTGDAAIMLDVLAPDDVGMTTQDQPSLFWFQSKPSDAKLEVTVLEAKKVKPLVQLKVPRATQAGIQRLRLSDHGVKLQPGVEYQWVVALITDSDNRSTDQVASGVIKRIEPAADLKKKISKAPLASAPAIYAEEGIWYDALAALSDQIDAQPENKGLRQTRSELLQQAGLKSAAQADISQ